MSRLIRFFKIVCLILCIGGVAAKGQHYNIDWVNSIGSLNSEYITSVVLDKQGYVYAAGSFVDTLDFDPSPGRTMLLPKVEDNNIQSTFIFKCAADRKPIWVKEFKGNSNANIFYQKGASMANDGMANLYLTGNFTGTIDFDPSGGTANLTAGANGSFFIVKLDSAGNFRWAKQIDPGNGSVYSFAVSSDIVGNIAVTGIGFGSANDSIDFDPAAGVAKLSMPSYDMFVLRLDSAGNYLWAKTFGTDTDMDYRECSGNAITIDDDNNTLVTGIFTGTVDFDPGPGSSRMTALNSNYDIFVLKLDGAGNYVWAGSMGSPNAGDYGWAIATDAQRNVYTTGLFGHTGGIDPDTSDFDPGPEVYPFVTNGSSDIFISKLNAAGHFVWAKKLGGISYDQGNSIYASADGYIYTGGTVVASDSAGAATIDFDPGPGNYSPVVLQAGAQHHAVSILDTGGNFVWGAMYAPAANMAFSYYTNSPICADADHNIYLGGLYRVIGQQAGLVNFDPTQSSTSTEQSNSVVDYAGSLLPDDNTDMFLMKLSPCIETATVAAKDCDNYSFRGKNYTASGVFINTIPPIPGICDTIYTLDLILGHTTNDTLSIVECDSFRYNNQHYTASGYYVHQFETGAGCDSIRVINLTITGITPDTTVNQFGLTLTSLASDASYQWIDCNSNTPVANATSSSFTPSRNGSYAVVVTGSGGCADTSSCYAITGLTGINEAETGNIASFYPNPARSILNVRTRNAMASGTMRLISMQGQTIWETTPVNGSSFQIDLSMLAAGVYTLEIAEATTVSRAKVIKE